MLKNKEEVNMTKKITIAIRSHIDTGDIKNLIDSASRGSAYWCNNDLGYESETIKALTIKGCIVSDSEEEKHHLLNITKIKKGLTVMAKKYPNDFADFIKSDYDQNTGDIFLQCCLFGEVIYS